MAAALACVFVHPVRADVLHLTNGAKIEGKVEKTSAGFKVQTRGGTSVIPFHRVRRWEKQLTPAEEYRRRRERLGDSDFAGHVTLGKWCRANRLPQQARWHLMFAVAIRPDDARARRAAGFIRQGDRWISRGEHRRRQGYVRYGNSWLPAAKAVHLRVKKEREEKARQAYREGWRLLRVAARMKRDMPLEPTAEKLAAMGPAIMLTLKQASRDASIRVREAAILALGRLHNRKSLQLLLRRLRTENKRRLELILARQLAAHPDRVEALEGLLDLAINRASRRQRQRGCRGLQALANLRVIDALVPQVDYHVTPATPMNPEGQEKTKDGATILSSSQSPFLKPYYPCHEALRYLTGMRLPLDKRGWKDWWARARATFNFKPLPELPPRK